MVQSTSSVTSSMDNVRVIVGLQEDSVVFVRPRSGDFLRVMTVSVMAMPIAVTRRQESVSTVSIMLWGGIVISVL